MFDCGATESEARDPLLRTMRNCEWATSHIFISLALSALLGYPTTGRAGWGADVHFMGLENNMTSAARSMLELETSYMVARQVLRIRIHWRKSEPTASVLRGSKIRLVAYSPKGWATILRTSIITFDACYSGRQFQVVALLGCHTP